MTNHQSIDESSPLIGTSDGVCARGLEKVYGKRSVVKGVDLEVGRGEIVGLLGPNGAGKTTTFYMIVGLVKATAGTVYLDGRNITREPLHRRARRGIGYLPQEPSIFTKMSVRDNVRAVAELLPLRRANRDEKIDAVLERMRLLDVVSQKAYTLSGGERRRLEIARALVMDPQFILMDEPFSGVDPISVSELQETIRDLQKAGISILITDHNVRETLTIVDRAYLLFDGRILSQGTSEFLVSDPDSLKFYLGEDFAL
ncbi:MAG: LPS export ABC transporter ATP-binding protein [Verrucomicrobiota bacterium]